MERLFNLAPERSRRAVRDEVACAEVRILGVKNFVKRFGVTEGFFLMRLLRRGLATSSEAISKVTVSLAGRSGVRSMARIQEGERYWYIDTPEFRDGQLLKCIVRSEKSTERNGYRQRDEKETRGSTRGSR